jgi:hypothetical protein
MVPWRFRWFAVAYLLLVLVATVVAFGWFDEPGADASFGGIWLILVTMPTSLLVAGIDAAGADLLLLGAAAQVALLFGWCWWLDRARA